MSGRTKWWEEDCWKMRVTPSHLLGDAVDIKLHIWPDEYSPMLEVSQMAREPDEAGEYHEPPTVRTVIEVSLNFVEMRRLATQLLAAADHVEAQIRA